MSDDQQSQTSPEAAIPFSERVTIDTLANRPDIPSFDSSPDQWQPETAVRLEGKFTNTRGDDSLRAQEPVVVIIGPDDDSGPREIAVYYKDSGQRERSLDGYYMDDSIKHAGEKEVSTVVREGEKINLRFGREGNPQRSTTPTLEIESIKSGPLT